MTSNGSDPAAASAAFLEAVGELAAYFGWPLRSFTRDDEVAAFAPLDHDPVFEQIVWVHDATHSYVRCLLVGRRKVPAEREAAILELCARINDGLLFGCAEYSFADCTMVFRDSAPLVHGELAELVRTLTNRLLNFASRYAPAMRATLDGVPAAEALSGSDPSQDTGGGGPRVD